MPDAAEVTANAFINIATAATAAGGSGNVLVVVDRWDAMADAIAERGVFFHHTGGNNWATMRGPRGAEITVTGSRPKNVSVFRTVIEYREKRIK